MAFCFYFFCFGFARKMFKFRDKKISIFTIEQGKPSCIYYKAGYKQIILHAKTAAQRLLVTLQHNTPIEL
jgi:hypothetical protein